MAWIAISIVLGLSLWLAMRTAYRAGVCDGYRFARRPRDRELAHLIPILRAAHLVAPTHHRGRR